MVKVKHISKSFSNHLVLKDVSLSLEKGRITALIGSNGAGKSTLIGLIMDYYRLEKGKISKDSISVMPDTQSMYDELKGIDLLNLMLKIISNASRESAFQLCERLGMTEALKKKIKSYSFGMRKKLSFIQAAIGQTDTYIFDEPTSGVDPKSAQIMLDIVEELKSSGASILLTSHNLDELEIVSDYVYILQEGKVIRSGTIEEMTATKEEGLVYILKTKDQEPLLAFLSDYDEIEVLNEHTLKVTLDSEEDFNQLLLTILNQHFSISEAFQYRKSLKEIVYGV